MQSIIDQKKAIRSGYSTIKSKKFLECLIRKLRISYVEIAFALIINLILAFHNLIVSLNFLKQRLLIYRMSIRGHNIRKYIVSVFVICMYNLISAQTLTIKQIDSLGILAKTERIKGNYKKSLQIYLLNLKESERLRYSKGVAESHFGAGFVFNNLGNHSKAIEHFTIAEQQEYTQTNLAMQSEINRFIGGSYTDLGLYKNAIEKQKKQSQLQKK